MGLFLLYSKFLQSYLVIGFELWIVTRFLAGHTFDSNQESSISDKEFDFKDGSRISTVSNLNKNLTVYSHDTKTLIVRNRLSTDILVDVFINDQIKHRHSPVVLPPRSSAIEVSISENSILLW